MRLHIASRHDLRHPSSVARFGTRRDSMGLDSASPLSASNQGGLRGRSGTPCYDSVTKRLTALRVVFRGAWYGESTR